MIKKNDLGNICHEHLEFYTYKSLKYLFEKNGLYILKLNLMKSMEEVIEFLQKNLKKSISYNEKTKLIDIKKFIKRTIHNKK